MTDNGLMLSLLQKSGDMTHQAISFPLMRNTIQLYSQDLHKGSHMVLNFNNLDCRQCRKQNPNSIFYSIKFRMTMGNKQVEGLLNLPLNLAFSNVLGYSFRNHFFYRQH